MEQLNQLAIRNRNLKRVYEEICRTGESSRAYAAQKLSLSRPSLSSLADELIEDGLITENGKKVGSGIGRNPVILTPLENTNFIVSILWKNGYIEGRLIDIAADGDWKSESSKTLTMPIEQPAEYAKASQICSDRLSKGIQSRQNILGTVLIIPGIVDPVREQILSYPLGITEEVGHSIIQDLNLNHSKENICLVNDTAALAYGEQLYHRYNDATFLYINFAVGIGSVFYMHGKPLEDATGRHTQFGHIVVNPNGPMCECGSRGCLEAMIGEKAIRDRFELIFSEYGNMKLGEGNYYRALREKAEQKDIEAVAAMNEIIATFSLALSNVVTAMDPQKVIIGGNGHELGDYFLEKVKAKVREIGYDYIVRDLDISYSSLNSNVIYKAGADYAFDAHYNFSQKSLQGLHLG